jgi:hypothetical protein
MAGRKREPLRPVEHAIVTGAAAWRDRVRFEPPCYALRNTEGRIMDRAQIASEYRKSSQTCLLRAKRATIPLIGQSSQGSGEALARLYDDMSPYFALCTQFGRAPRARRKRHVGGTPDEAGVIPNLKAIERALAL